LPGAPPAGWKPPPAPFDAIQLGAPGRDDGDRWFNASQLADLTSGLLDEVLADLESTRGYRDGKAKGGGLSLFLAATAIDAVVLAVDGLPMPELRPERTWIRLTERGVVAEMRVAGVAAVEPSIPAVRDNLRLLLDPLFTAIWRRTRFSVVGQWAQVESALASSLLDSHPDSSDEILAFLDALAASDDQLRRARPRISWVEWQGTRHPYATRRVCCFNYRGSGGEFCGSQCPIVDPAARAADARAQVAHAAATSDA